MSEPVLCYVDGQWAYFTTQALEDQWGDDWNDAPYEHNAGAPYEPIAERGESWEIIQVAYEADLWEPRDGFSRGRFLNSPFSVQDINRRQVAWLRSYDASTLIWAGTTLSEFKRIVWAAGGAIYLREEPA